MLQNSPQKTPIHLKKLPSEAEFGVRSSVIFCRCKPTADVATTHGPRSGDKAPDSDGSTKEAVILGGKKHEKILEITGPPSNG